MSVDARKNVLTDSCGLLLSFPDERTSSLWGQLSPLRNAFQYVWHQPVVQVLIVLISSAGKVQTVLLSQQEKFPPFLLQRYIYKRSWEHSRRSHKSILVRAEFFFFFFYKTLLLHSNAELCKRLQAEILHDHLNTVPNQILQLFHDL